MADRTAGFFANWRQNIIYIGFVVIFAVFAVTLADKGFLNPTNLLNIIRQTAMIAVMAVAMTFVLASGEIEMCIRDSRQSDTGRRLLWSWRNHPCRKEAHQTPNHPKPPLEPSASSGIT